MEKSRCAAWQRICDPHGGNFEGHLRHHSNGVQEKERTRSREPPRSPSLRPAGLRRAGMNDLELIFTMLGEAATTEIAQKKDARGFEKNRDAARKGGTIAGDARKKLELESGTPVFSKENYLERTKTKKKLRSSD